VGEGGSVWGCWMVSGGRFVWGSGERESAARFLRDMDVAEHDRRLFGMKDRQWGCHPFMLQLPAMLLHVVVPHSPCVRDAGADGNCANQGE
jgi:hypothetical protein